jgi:hypothetical protein
LPVSESRPQVFLDKVIYPTLSGLALHETADQLRSAAQLLLGTAVHESGGLVHRRQMGGGPALGLFQIEPFTFIDTFEHYLDFRAELREQVLGFARPGDLTEQLVDNDAFACAVARIVYFRKPRRLPNANDLLGHAEMWKADYNTHLGKGTVDKYIADAFHHIPWLYPPHVWEAARP